jgi:hypothetical protein
MPLVQHFYRNTAQVVEKQLRLNSKNPLMLQVLQAGFPKLWRIFSDLSGRVLLVNDKYLLEPLLYKSLALYESAYISRSLSRLLECVNSAFGNKRPSKDDVDRLMRAIARFLI